MVNVSVSAARVFYFSIVVFLYFGICGDYKRGFCLVVNAMLLIYFLHYLFMYFENK